MFVRQAIPLLLVGLAILMAGHSAAASDLPPPSGASRDSALAWRRYGAALHRQERYPEALRALDRALSLSPRDFAARFNRGLTLSELGRFRDAVVELNRAIAIRPGFAPAWTERGAARVLIGRVDEAHADWRRSLELDPTYVWPHFYRGLNAIVQGDYAAAAADLDTVAARDSLAMARIWRWAAHRLAGNAGVPLPTPTPEWPGPIADHLRGDRSASQLIEAARADRLPLDDRRLAGAWFFIGVKHRVEGRNAEARTALERARRARSPAFTEVLAAKSLLRERPR